MPAFQPKHFPLLDGIRGLAIASVLLFHAFFERAPHSTFEYVIRKLCAPFWLGVNIFFVLSGFLITGILIDTRRRRGYFSSFYARRSLRIFPLYFATLASMFLLLPALRSIPAIPLIDQIPAWTYTYNWSTAFGYPLPHLNHLWSLSVEEQFYLVWPLVIYFTPPKHLARLLVTLIALSFLFRLTLYFNGQLFTYAYYLTPSRAEDLCFGALAAWVVRSPAARETVRRFTPRLAAAGLLLLAISAIAGQGFEANKWPALLYGTTTVCSLTALAIVYSTAAPLNRWWGAPPLRWLGTYSYGIYVLHQPLLNYANRVLLDMPIAAYAGGMLLAVTFSCAAGWASYQCFERYFLRLKTRFASTQPA